MNYDKPSVVDYGSIAEHTFVSTDPRKAIIVAHEDAVGERLAPRAY